ncbi:MAG: YggS family pyridoxal phosphate-dependent enzyme [Planctomycetota bacterium]|nr:YggS family pyridoxal phosphate-dependent enzyme [Planctomycetota bacterium]
MVMRKVNHLIDGNRKIKIFVSGITRLSGGTMEERVKERVSVIRRRVEEAAWRAGRSPAEVQLIVVTKRVGVDVIAALARSGIKEIGENYVQDAALKRRELGEVGGSLRWHMIGHLQRNKVKKALEIFDVLHSLDSVGLASILQSSLKGRMRRLPVFIEVKTSGEETKFGASEEEMFKIAEFVIEHSKEFDLMGLMTMAPYFEEAEKARPYFAKLRWLRGEVQRRFGGDVAPYLSMGMSSDFEVAVEEGATHIRIGDAIVGGL